MDKSKRYDENAKYLDRPRGSNPWWSCVGTAIGGRIIERSEFDEVFLIYGLALLESFH